jgi:hypothetical protein
VERIGDEQIGRLLGEGTITRVKQGNGVILMNATTGNVVDTYEKRSRTLLPRPPALATIRQ